jgi:hypothetical protein
MLRAIVFFGFLSVASLAFAQGENNSLKGVPAGERVVSGGGFGLGFSSTRSYISLSPVLAYQITKRLMAGSSVTYRFTQLKYTPPIKLHDYGLSPFARFTVYKGFFLQADYEYLNYEFPISQKESTREQFTSFMAGGGIFRPINDKVGFYVMALYNFSYEAPSASNIYYPYASPWVIRFGFNVGKFSF